MTEPQRPRRPVAMPSHLVAAVCDGRLDPEAALLEVDLLERLQSALAALPQEQRTAVVAAHGYAEGPVGAAVELDCDVPAADELAERGLAALRAAMQPEAPG